MKQQMDIVRQLLQLLLDKNISLQSQYGAIVCLISLGYRILFMYFWPVMERYFPLLEEKYQTCSSADITHVKGAIMVSSLFSKLLRFLFYFQLVYLFQFINY